MNLEFFNQNNDNFYKYVVIIGLSLFLIPQFTDNSIIDNMVESIKLEHESKMQYEESKLRVKKSEDICNRAKEKVNAFYVYLNTHAIEMNLYLLDGTRVKTFDDLAKLWDYVSKMNLETENVENINKTIEKFQIILGKPKNVNNVKEIIDEAVIRIDFIKDFLDQNLNELALLEEEAQKALDENIEFLREIKNIESELKRIELENRIYEKEKMLNTIIKFTGGIMIIIGGILWYIKIQRYLDRLYKRSPRIFYRKNR